MTPVTTYANKRVALFGLGGSGMITAKALLRGGAHVVAFDDNPLRVEEALKLGIKTRDLREVNFRALDGFVLAPGVPLTHPQPHWSVTLAKEAGTAIIGDVELLAEQRSASVPNAPLIAITGTNGKSTTTALIAHILAVAGLDVQMGGNIGKAVLSLEPPSLSRVHVVECSSYQIDLAPGLNPSVGILLNLTPDHLDRHGTMENYATIKERLVAKSDFAIVGVEDDYCRSIANKLETDGVRLTRICLGSKLSHGYSLGDNSILLKDGEPIASLAGCETLRGNHNVQNALAAMAAAVELGIEPQTVETAFKTFPGLVHRMELVGHQAGRLFVNDSKATNADAAAKALSSFDRIHWIAGGLAKQGGIEGLVPWFTNVERAYLIGEAAPEFAATLGMRVPFEIAATLDVAVERAADMAREGDTVLFSPACASFDQFPNFEKRGEAFRKEVAKLKDFRPYGESQ